MKITDKFWSKYLNLIKDTVIPFQWQMLNDKIPTGEGESEVKSHAIQNLKIAAGLESGEHNGYWFQDTDVYKWLEGIAHILNHYPNKELEVLADGVVDLIEAAMEDDGYLNTYYQIKSPHLKFKELHLSHEMYCCGHLIEAGVSYYETTGKDKLLKLACRFADCIDNNFGPQNDKMQAVDGHQLIESALVKLYESTGEQKYLNLSQFLLEVRSSNVFKEDDFYTPKYLQAYSPPIKQTTAEGHAVRLVYMCTGMADVAYHTNNTQLLNACKKIWDNITQKRMYVTGGIGSTHHGEAFTFDYDLPNDTMYCETCASIGLMYFANSMLKNEPNSKYADIMELALYNNSIAGMSLNGREYFYVNPLESDPKANRPDNAHVKSSRQGWFGCACCPPNLVRTVSSIDKYISSLVKGNLYTHLYIGYEGKETTQAVEWGEKEIKVTFNTKAKVGELNFRLPKWTKTCKLYHNGEGISEPIINNGYITLKKQRIEDTVILHLSTPILEIISHPKVRANTGKATIQKGPFIYCMEEVDNGGDLHLIHLNNTNFEVKYKPWLQDVPILEGTGEKLSIDTGWEGNLYSYDIKDSFKPCNITLVPYFAWANRDPGEMRVWINRAQYWSK